MKRRVSIVGPLIAFFGLMLASIATRNEIGWHFIPLIFAAVLFGMCIGIVLERVMSVPSRTQSAAGSTVRAHQPEKGDPETASATESTIQPK
jgi:branched-subunit amino acid ABC-type transport system permease component